MPRRIELDLHLQTEDSARKILTSTLKNLPDDVTEIDVIHGYHGGSTLRDMVRRYNNSRIERKIIGMNPGVTTFIIRKPGSSRLH